MGTALGLIGIVCFISCVIALAYSVTLAVVSVSPSPDKKPKPDAT